MSVSQTLQAMQDKGLSRLDAQMLLLHLLQKPTNDRAWLMSHDTDELTMAQQQVLESLVQRRIKGEPVAYITGSKEFFGLNFKVTSNVLVPRPDTECLVAWALEVLPLTLALSHKGRGDKSDADSLSLGGRGLGRGGSVLDLGTGSGAIGLAIKHSCPQAAVTLVDASQAALDVACGNATSLSLAVHGLQSNWFENMPSGERFDLIVSNPPYIADGDAHLAALKHEPMMALTSGADGLDAIRRIVQDAPEHLKQGGWLLLEHGYDQATKVRALLQERGFAQVSSRLDLNGIERCSGGCLKH